MDWSFCGPFFRPLQQWSHEDVYSACIVFCCCSLSSSSPLTFSSVLLIVSSDEQRAEKWSGLHGAGLKWTYSCFATQKEIQHQMVAAKMVADGIGLVQSVQRKEKRRRVSEWWKEGEQPVRGSVTPGLASRRGVVFGARSQACCHAEAFTGTQRQRGGCWQQVASVIHPGLLCLTAAISDIPAAPTELHLQGNLPPRQVWGSMEDVINNKWHKAQIFVM